MRDFHHRCVEAFPTASTRCVLLQRHQHNARAARIPKCAVNSNACWAAASRLRARVLPLLSEGAKCGFVRGPIMQRRRIKIGTVRPDDGVHLGIDAHLIEQPDVAERTEHLTGQHRREVDAAFEPVVEAQMERKRRRDGARHDPIDGMAHQWLGERINRHGGTPLLQARPVIEQLLLVQLRPRLDQPALARGQ